jgi:hypothetical protein
MRRIVLLVIAPLAFLSAACGTTTSDEPSLHPPPGGTAPDPKRLYEANTIVLEDQSHGPMLCLGGVLESLPPQCGDVPVAGWNWAKVNGEETVGETTWGAYHVVGTYDGERFVVVEAGPTEKDDSPSEPDFSSPCDEPPGGWTGRDHATQNDDDAAHAYARSQPDYVTSWVTHIDPAAQERSPVIVNVVFTGEAARHEAALRRLWSGPLCVVARDVPSASELGRIRKEAEASLDDLGLQMLWSAGPGVEPIIEIGVVADPAGQGQAAFDDRYGAGIVRVQSALQPVS